MVNCRIFYRYWLLNLQKRALNDCFTITNAVVVEKYKQKKRGTYIQYKYVVDGKEYFSTENSSIKKGTDKIYLGDTMRVKISCSNPDISEIFKK